MTQVSLKHIHEDLEFVKRELAELRAMLEEDYELSEWAKKRIEEHRKAPKESYVSQEEVEKAVFGR